MIFYLLVDEFLGTDSRDLAGSEGFISEFSVWSEDDTGESLGLFMGFGTCERKEDLQCAICITVKFYLYFHFSF